MGACELFTALQIHMAGYVVRVSLFFVSVSCFSLSPCVYLAPLLLYDSFSYACAGDVVANTTFSQRFEPGFQLTMFPKKAVMSIVSDCF